MVRSPRLAGLRTPRLVTLVVVVLAIPFVIAGAPLLGPPPVLAVGLAVVAMVLTMYPLRVGEFSRFSAADAVGGAMIVLLPPGLAGIVAGAARLSALAIGRDRPERMVRRAAAQVVATGTAAVIFLTLRSLFLPWIGDTGEFVAGVVAGIVYLTADLATVSAVMRLTRRVAPLGDWRSWFLALFRPRAMLVLAGVATGIIGDDRPGLLLIAVPVLWMWYRGLQERFHAERRLRLLTTLIEASRALGSTLDPSEVFRTVHAQVRSVMDADGFYVALTDHARQVVRYRFLATDGNEYPPRERPFATTTAGVCIARGEAILMRDTLIERPLHGLSPRSTFGAGAERSLIVAPLRIRGEVIGAISTQSVRPAAYDDSDLELLGAIANEAAVAIERADLHARSAALSRRLYDLHRIGLELAAHRELGGLTRALSDAVVRLTGCTDAAVYLLEGGLLRCSAVASGKVPSVSTIDLRNSVGAVAIDLERPVAIADSLDLPPEARRTVEGFGHRAVAIQPLRAADEPIGVLFATWQEPHAMSEEEREVVALLAGVGATALRSIRLYHELDEAYVSTVAALTTTIEARDHYAGDHQRKVAAGAIALGERLGLRGETLRDLRYAALFHALGKIAVPAAVLGKSGPLTPEERDLVREHPVLGARILESIPFLRGVVPIVRHTNERWDGSGYPAGLRANDVPYAARILQIVVSWQAMLVDRPYRPALAPDLAIAELRALAGVRYDPVLVIEFVRMVEERGAVAAAEEQFSAATSRELAVLAQITPEFHQLLDVQTLLDRVLAILERHFPGSFFTILLEDGTTKDLVVRASRGPRTDLIGPTRLPASRGISGWVFEHRESQLVEDVRADPRYIGDPTIRSEVNVPLVSNGRAIGIIAADHATVGAYTQRDLTLLQTVGAQIAAAIDVAELHERLKRAANIDALTGIHNYGYFYQRLEEEIARAERRKTPLAVAFFDIDGLKRVNDTHGHLAGNAVLRTLGKAIGAQVRTEDVPARYGGDEFAIVMPDTPREEAEKVVQRLMDTLDHSEVELEGGGRIPMPRRSWGVAAYPLDGHDARSLVENADTRSYARKRSRS